MGSGGLTRGDVREKGSEELANVGVWRGIGWRLADHKGWHLRGGDWIHGWDGRGLRVLCKAECSDITDM